VSRSEGVGGKSFKSKKKKKKEKKLGGERGKIKLQKKLKSRLKMGKPRKSTWDGTWIKTIIL
jgi:hypothetical protein